MDVLAQEDQTKLEKALKVAQTKDNEMVDLGEEVMGLTDDLQKVRLLFFRPYGTLRGECPG